jgi:hypothetical protein
MSVGKSTMNENIEKLLKEVWPDPKTSHVNHLKFAELIVGECLNVIKNSDGDLDFAIWKLQKHFGVE